MYWVVEASGQSSQVSLEKSWMHTLLMLATACEVGQRRDVASSGTALLERHMLSVRGDGIP